MTKPLTVGVIGLGHLGAHHARLLAQSSRWALSAVFDIDPAKNSVLAGQYGLAPCASADDAIARCQAVVICTPTESHFNLATAAMRSGRHVFVEKPLCAAAHESDILIDQMESRGLIGAVGHIERFNPAVIAVRDDIEKPRFIEAHRLNSFSPRGLATDVILEMMIHDIDLARWLVGEEPSEIRAAGVAVLSGTDDIANCRLGFPGGCVANLTASRISTSPMRKLRIFSVSRYTSIDLQSKSAETYRLFDSSVTLPAKTFSSVATWQGRTIGRHSAEVADSNALEAELDDFHEAVIKRRLPRVGFAEGSRSLKVALAVALACRKAAEIAKDGSAIPA